MPLRILLVIVFTIISILSRPLWAKTFSVVEATIPQMQAAMEAGNITSREIVTQYLVRMALYENTINAALSVNPKVLAIADALDRERAAGKLRGPLHGIPIAIKDNIHTDDMPTTAGTLALEGFIAPYEATLVARLREAGAIIIAKTVLTEMANWMVLGMPNNYSAIGGFAFNPYDPRRDMRPGRNDGRGVLPTGSSSSGAGTAANFWAANIGTETVNSVIGPSSANMLAAIKPTIGRISRWGIIPVSYDQDSAGPMTKNITDAAILLGAMEGVDPNDPMTTRCKPPVNNDYTAFLKANALNGARIGVPRAWFMKPHLLPDRDIPAGGLPHDQIDMMEEAIAIMRSANATLIDPADVPSTIEKEWNNNPLVHGTCSAGPSFRDNDDSCSIVLKYSFKRDINTWFDTLNGTARVSSLTELRQWNVMNAALGTLKYAQHTLDVSDEMDPSLEEDQRRYKADRARDISLSGENGIDAVLKQHNLDALIFAGSRASGLLAKAGYPSVTVPFGMVTNTSGDHEAFPESFKPNLAPLGVTFSGTECSEPKLIALAYAFEQITKRRMEPKGF